MSTSAAPPPQIPASVKFSSMEVGVAKIGSIVGDALSTLNTWKGSVRVASTANLTLSAAQTIDGVAAVVGDLVLAKNQTDGIQNGIYQIQTGAWTRATSLITGTNAAGIALFVNEGTLSADTIWVCTNDAATATVGTNALVFASQTSVAKADVTQITSITNPVTANGSAGTITLFTSALTAGTSNIATPIIVTNSSVVAGSAIQVTIVDYSGVMATHGIPYVTVDTIGAGNFNIVLTNVGAQALAGVVKFSYAVL